MFKFAKHLVFPWLPQAVLQQSVRQRFCSINSHYKSYDSTERIKTDTFKSKSFKYFQSSGRYRELSILENPQKFHKSPEASRIKTLISDLSFPPTTQLGNQNQTPNQRIQTSQLEEEISLILNGCCETEALSITHMLLNIAGENLKRGVFYRILLSKVCDWINNCSGSEDLVYWGFICSMQRSASNNGLRLIYERFKSDVTLFENLSLIEVSILCNAWFSNNILVSSKAMLRVIEKKLQKEIVSSPGFISQEALCLLKVLRKSCFGTDQLYDALILSLSSPAARGLNLAEASHALALLADNRCLVNGELGKNVVHLITVNAKKPIQGPDVFLHPSRGTRVKDLTRFLWTASCLIPPDEALRQRIATEIIDQVENGWNRGHFTLEKDCHLLSDFFLSLACWNIYPKSLIEKVVDRTFVDTVIKQKQTIRQSRLALFLAAVQIESSSLELEPTFFNQVAANLPPYKVERELLKRPHLSRLAGAIDRHREELEWNDIQCHTTVPHLNLAGITFNSSGIKVAVEVLDSYVCMRHSSRPERLLAFKMRLSKQLGYRVIALDVQQDNRKQQEAEAENDCYRNHQVTSIRQFLESDYVNEPRLMNGKKNPS